MRPIHVAHLETARTVLTLTREVVRPHLTNVTVAQLLFRLVAGAYERQSLAIGSHWPFEEWGRFLPERTTASASWTGSCTTPPSSSPTASHTA